NLVNEDMQFRTLELLDREIATSRLLLSEAERHYSRGLDTYLPVVSALVQTQELEISRLRQQAALIKYRIGLHRSLGGGWGRNPNPASPPGKTPAPDKSSVPSE
ncbi:MAG: hypothetical protein MI747_16340, partial [Desulfobacterales bacterium]|nr:hypothetical protein [Desulfobacterales bacterium]